MPELIVFVGLPASGKSTYYRSHFSSTHVHVSKDRMPSTRDRDAKQRLLIESALAKGESVVVDNTNPSAADRAPLIEIGRRHGARIVAYYFETNVRTSIMRNRERQGKERVPDVAIFVTQKKLVAPSVDEGFDEVHVISA